MQARTVVGWGEEHSLCDPGSGLRKGEGWRSRANIYQVPGINRWKGKNKTKTNDSVSLDTYLTLSTD